MSRDYVVPVFLFLGMGVFLISLWTYIERTQGPSDVYHQGIILSAILGCFCAALAIIAKAKRSNARFFVLLMFALMAFGYVLLDAIKNAMVIF